MPTFPVRNLGGAGIVTDVNPFDIEDTAVFTAGVNVRFRNGKVSRAPVPRSVIDLDFQPRHLISFPQPSSGYDQLIMASDNFATFKRLDSGALTDISPTPALSGLGGGFPITSCFLGGVSYLNCASDVPVYFGPTSTKYAKVPALPSTIRFRVLRAFKDQLVGLGVYKGSDYFPTMVKWSDLTSFGAPPGDWDPASTTNSAGENIINEMQHEIVDGLALRNDFAIYCTNSVWGMQFTGDNSIYSWTKLFDDRGVINVNCVVQVGGQHFVFDRNDIYTHDGGAPRSIVDGKVREFIFNGLDTSKLNLCFVTHEPRMSEIRFCYPASDDLVGWQNPTTGCNRMAVYNYANTTWTFDDIPNVTHATRAALSSGRTWDDPLNVSWDDTQGMYTSSEGDANQHTFFVSKSDTAQGLPTPRLYGYDLLTGGSMTYPIAPDALKPAFLQRTGLDLDSMGKNLTQYAHLQAVWPQVYVENPSDAYWQFGANDLVNVEPAWSEEISFDPATENKIDINEAGKYLAWRYGCRGQGDFQLSGLDVLMIIRGRR